MSKSDVKTYEIDGSTYELRPLVFGQWQQLNEIMAQVEMPAVTTQRNIVAAIGRNLDQVLAVILTEEGQPPEDKDLPRLAKFLAFRMSPEQVAEVIADFFAAAPVASLLNLVAGVVGALQEKLFPPTGSSSPSLSSATETGPNDTASSGDAAQKKPSPGSSTEGES